MSICIVCKICTSPTIYVNSRKSIIVRHCLFLQNQPPSFESVVNIEKKHIHKKNNEVIHSFNDICPYFRDNLYSYSNTSGSDYHSLHLAADIFGFFLGLSLYSRDTRQNRLHQKSFPHQSFSGF